MVRLPRPLRGHVASGMNKSVLRRERAHSAIQLTVIFQHSASPVMSMEYIRNLQLPGKQVIARELIIR